MGLNFEIRESEYYEDMNLAGDPYELAKMLAFKKAEDVARHYDDAVVIGGDTFVVFKNKFIGKPRDEADAKRILREFSGEKNEAVSGFAIIDTKSGKVINGCGKVIVKFKDLTDDEIDSYVATGEPLDVAGAYRLMNRAAFLIEAVEGDFYSAVGLPMHKLYLGLKKVGVDALKIKK